MYLGLGRTLIGRMQWRSACWQCLALADYPIVGDFRQFLSNKLRMIVDRGGARAHHGRGGDPVDPLEAVAM